MPILTLNEAKRLARVERMTIWRWAKAGTIKTIKRDVHTFYDRASVIRAANARRAKAKKARAAK